MKTAKSFFEYEPPERHQMGLETRCLLLLPPAFLLALKYDLPHILILTALMVVFPILLLIGAGTPVTHARTVAICAFFAELS